MALECAVCLSEVSLDELYSHPHTRHSEKFHKKCVAKYFFSQKANKCVLCGDFSWKERMVHRMNYISEPFSVFTKIALLGGLTALLLNREASRKEILSSAIFGGALSAGAAFSAAMAKLEVQSGFIPSSDRLIFSAIWAASMVGVFVAKHKLKSRFDIPERSFDCGLKGALLVAFPATI